MECEIRTMVHKLICILLYILFNIEISFMSCIKKDHNNISTHIRQISILSIIHIICNISLCVKYVSIRINVKIFKMAKKDDAMMLSSHVFILFFFDESDM